MRTRKKKWTAAELENNPRIWRDTGAYAGGLRTFFRDDNPVHVELGCGKGRFITHMAALHPEIHYVAIERDPTILAAAARAARDTAGSLLFVMADATALPDYFLPGDISRLYINFCDPWPNKKKWAKRRLTHGHFLALYEQLRVPEIHFKTDNRVLFGFSIESFSDRGWHMRHVSLDLHRDGLDGNIMTEYEEKFASLNQPIYRLEAYCPRETARHDIDRTPSCQ